MVRDNSVSIQAVVTDALDFTPKRGWDSSIRQQDHVRIGSGVHPTSYPIGTVLGGGDVYLPLSHIAFMA
jgi:hypothetical protein